MTSLISDEQLFFHKSRSKVPFTEFKLEGDIQKNPFNNHWGIYFVHPDDAKFIRYIGDGVDVYARLKIVNPFVIVDAVGGVIGSIKDMDGQTYSAINPTKEFCAGLISRGYDGLLIENGIHYNQYVAFYPHQITIVETKLP